MVQAIAMHKIKEEIRARIFVFFPRSRPRRRLGAKTKHRRGPVRSTWGREKRICAMLLVSAQEAAFKAKENEKSCVEERKNESYDRANGGMAEACLTLKAF